MQCRWRLFFILTLLLSFQRVVAGTDKVAATDYVRLCTLQASEIIPVTFDKESGMFVEVNDYKGNNNNTASGNNNRELLRRASNDAVTPAIFVSRYRRIQTENVTGQVHYVRHCQCTYQSPGDEQFSAYCPLDKGTCGVPRSTDEHIGCFNQSSRTSLIRNAWPVIVLWYGALFLFLVFTTQGQNARHFVIGKCCRRNLNEHLVEQYWYIEGGFWRRRRRPRRPLPFIPVQDTRQQREEEVPPLPSNTLDHLTQHQPNQLALKTKRYVAPPFPVQEEDDVACTICFTPLQGGDRIGALPCNHSFHVDCLKEWLPRRNICPLCQAPDVAAPHYEPRHTAEENNSLIEEDVQQDSGDAANQGQSLSPSNADGMEQVHGRLADRKSVV